MDSRARLPSTSSSSSASSASFLTRQYGGRLSQNRGEALGEGGEVGRPSSSNTSRARRLSSSSDIDVSDVALAPNEGPPPVPLRGLGEAYTSSSPSSSVGRRYLAPQHGRSLGDASNKSYDGIVNGAVAESSATQSQDISPWMYQGLDNSHQEAGTPGKSRDKSSFHEPSSSPSMYASQVSLPLRPVTPPSTSSIFRGHSGVATPGSSQKKSKNPLSFFRKKSSATLRESSGDATSEESVPMPPRVPSGGSVGGSMPPGLSDSLLMGSRYNGMTSSSLDEELQRDELKSQGLSGAPYSMNGAPREAKRTRRIPRPRTRDKDSKKSKGAEEWASITEQSLSGHPMPTSAFNNGGSAAAGRGDGADVELSLDTDFNNIGDIVDLTKRQGSLVGPMNERLSPEGLLPTRPPLSPRSMTTRDRSSSLAGADRFNVTPPLPVASANANTGTSSTVLVRPPGPRRLASGPLPKVSTSKDSRGAAMDGSNSGGVIRPPAPWMGSDVGGAATLRKISKEEAQQYVALGARPAPALLPPHVLDHRLQRHEAANSEHDFRGGLTNIVTNPNAPLDGSRKSSMTSVQSAHSGVSPTSSVLDLNLPNPIPLGELAQGRGAGVQGTWNSVSFADGAYRFPDRQDRPRADSLGMRKSSGSSSNANVTSSWMAPDSWAVQHKQGRDNLRDDESGTDHSDGDDTDGPADRTVERASMGTPTLGPAHASSMDASWNIDGYGRRGTQDSTTSSISTDGPVNNGVFATQQDAPAIEYIDSTDASDATSTLNSAGLAAPTQPPTPTSAGSNTTRHGVRAGAIGIGSAAAAAAGKLGLHRPHRIRQQSSRPNTAGSIGAGGSSGLTAVAPSTAHGSRTIDDDATSTHRTSSPFVTKRPSTVGQSSAGTCFLRVTLEDGSHKALQIPLTASTSDIRAMLYRKAPSSVIHRMFVRDKGAERPLGESEKPGLLQRRRLLQAGYTEEDLAGDLGRDDVSFLLRFVYRPDSVTKIDSAAFGTTETDFRALDLENRNLEMVPISLYRRAEWIQSLNLSGNPMTDLPEDFVNILTNLTTLRMSRLALKRVPASIRSSQTLTHLDLSDNRIPELTHAALDEIPRLRSLKIQNNRLHDLPGYFAQMDTLMDLNISNNRFDIFPGVLCQMKSLAQLDISFNTISELPDELGQLVELQRLVLVGNNVVALPSSMSKLVNLQAVDLRRNMLQDVAAVFTLPKLQVLHCEENSLRNLQATIGPQLSRLNIGKNALSKASITAESTGVLTSLDLTSANLSKLDDDVLRRLPNLTHLILDRNNFIVLPETIGQLRKLTHLSCTHNVLGTLPEGIGQLTMLQELLVHNNNMKSLPDSIWKCGALHTLNLTSNLLEGFPDVPRNAGATSSSVDFMPTGIAPSPNALSPHGPSNGSISVVGDQRKGSTTSSTGGTTGSTGASSGPPLAHSLIRLRMGDNKLSEEVFEVLARLPNLEVLNLSCNEIFELPASSLSCHAKLTELYMSCNCLSTLPADELPGLQNLRILHLNGNKLSTLPAELGQVKSLVNLDVGNNLLKYNISNRQYDWNWNSNPSLRYLNLSGNKRFEIKSNPVVKSIGSYDPNRTSRRTMIDTSDFSTLSHLRNLGLMDVTVTLQQMPDEHDDRRVRTSLSHINQMAYGISDALGKHEHLSVVDMVTPEFRNMPNECLFGIFAGREHGRAYSSRIAYHLSDWAKFRIASEIESRRTRGSGTYSSPQEADVPHILRRAFLRMEKEFADLLMAEASRRVSETMTGPYDSTFATPLLPSQRHEQTTAALAQRHALNWKAGASAVVGYLVDRTLYIANVGDTLAVLSKNSTAHLISTRHDPFDREETLRIRSAEGWVSLQGQVNDKLNISRAFGHYHLEPIVNAAPAVHTVHLTDADEFIILANHTLWDKMSYQTAVDVARMERNDPMVAAQKLRDVAISFGAEDSIMVMVIAVGDLFNKARLSKSTGASFESPLDMAAARKATRRGREDRNIPGDLTLARLEREVAPPIGQVALVFTDIKNSTSLWETNGGMQTAMRLHNSLLRRQLRNIGGYEVKTEGDAFMVSFPSVTSALLWCFNVQLQLLRENWPQELIECEDGKESHDGNGELIYRGLSVRMGLHWGSPVCEADPITRRMDYFGPMVNRAARISGAADGGQILASRDAIAEFTTLLNAFDASSKKRSNSDRRASSEDEEEDDVDEDESEALRMMHPNVSRDVTLLRRMGFGISDMGEKRLKGLETPEFLNLVYPTQLAGRQSSENEEGDLRASNAAITQPPRVFEPTVQLLSIDEIKQLGYLCLRLESLSEGHVFPGISELIQSDPSNGLSPPLLGSAAAAATSTALVSSNSVMTSALARTKAVESHVANHPEVLICSIRDDAPDEELGLILHQLVVRIANCLAGLTIRQHILSSDSSATLNIQALLDLFR